MIISICILVLFYTLIKKPVGKLVEKLKDIDWPSIAHNIWESVKKFCIKAGINISYPLLTFYYVMSDENTSVSDKALVYGAILYILSPFDLVPRKVLHLLGILDDMTFAVFIYKKISSSVTPEIMSKVKATITEWFGNGITPMELDIDVEGNISI